MNPQLLSHQHGPVLVLTLSNPEARNALGPEIYAAGRQAFERAAHDASVRAIILTGEGSHFCAGGNVARLRENRNKPVEVPHASVSALHAWIMAMRACPKPILAAVEGAAAGAGFSLVLACDGVVAARDARFAMAYVRIGLSPDGGATYGLARRLPPAIAFEWLTSGSVQGAPRLAELGLINRLVDPGQAQAEAMRWASELALGPGKALGRIKELLTRDELASLSAQLDAERESLLACLYEPDAAEGLSAFLEKRAPTFNTPPEST